MNLYERALVLYDEYVQRILDEEARRVRPEETLRRHRLLIRLLMLRSGTPSEDMLARIQGAETVTLGHWFEFGLTAQSLDDTFA